MAEISILYIGVKPSPIMAELMSSKRYSIDVIVNNILDFELPPLVENAAPIWHRHELSNVLLQMNKEKFEISSSLSNLLRENDMFGLSDDKLAVTSHINQIELNSNNLLKTYELLRDQAEISNINLYPLLDEITQIYSYKNKKYAPLRYYDLKKQFLENELPEKIDEEKYKDKEFHVSSDEELKHMKLSSNSLKSMQDSNLVVIVPTDKISLAVLLYSKDLVKQVKSVKTPMLLIWGFDEEDEIVDEDLFIANELGYELSLSDFAKDLALLTDYVLLPKSLKDQIQELRDNDCHVLISEFFDDKGSVSDELISTLFKMANIEDSDNEEGNAEKTEKLDINDESGAKNINQLLESPEEAGNENFKEDVLGDYSSKKENIEKIIEDIKKQESGLIENNNQINSNLSDIDENLSEFEDQQVSFYSLEDEEWIDSVKRSIHFAMFNDDSDAISWLMQQIKNDDDKKIQIAEVIIETWEKASSSRERKRGAEMVSLISNGNRDIYTKILRKNFVYSLKENMEDRRRSIIQLIEVMKNIESEFTEELIRGITLDLISLMDDGINATTERAKTSLIQLIIYSRTLSRIAIRELIFILENKFINSEIWNILLALDAGIVAIELITLLSDDKIVAIVKEAKQLKYTGTYFDTINQVRDAWNDGDKEKISKIIGYVLPEETLRKLERIDIARKISKLKMVQLATLAESSGLSYENIERMITELIVNDEVKGELKIIEDKMYFVAVEENKKD